MSSLSLNRPQPASASAMASAANAVTLRIMVNPVSRSANYNVPQSADESSDALPPRGVRFAIPLELAGAGLDQALARLMPGESRSRLAKLIGEGHVRVDGEQAAGRMKLKSGEAVEVTLVARASEQPYRAEAIELTIVHEDGDVLVIDKPAGVVVQPGSSNWAADLLKALVHHPAPLSQLARAAILHT